MKQTAQTSSATKTDIEIEKHPNKSNGRPLTLNEVFTSDTALILERSE